MLDPNEWLSTGQAARCLGVSTQWVWKQAKAGALEHIATPNGFLYRRELIENIAQQRADRTPAGAA